MKLFELFDDLEIDGNIPVTGIQFNCDKVEKGNIFVALRGSKFDGHSFVQKAYERGAVLAVVERKVDCEIAQVKVANTRIELAKLSKKFYDNACDKVPVVGITGTNGKTTTSHILATILRENGFNPCIIGTNGVIFNGKTTDCNLTTPDPPQLHKIIFNAVKDGATHIIMEASAHALALEKLYGITFSVGAFTNFTQDHLDYFGDMGAYYRAKSKLKVMSKEFVINCDDNRVTAICDGSELSFGFSEHANIKIRNFCCCEYGSTFNLGYEKEFCTVTTALVGEFNAYNFACAVGLAIKLGVNFSLACELASKLKRVDGRFNLYVFGKNKAVIDFAHTEDGLENLLINARLITAGRVVLVFGCGGDRDKSKREKMGAVAGKLSDTVIITSDNPRNENPMDIINAIEKGIKCVDLVDYRIEIDRKKAIELGYSLLNDGDILVIAGKGAEKYQEINGIKH
ncbi:MAG: UDP-N-acetylmuramoyl-L-alanyl-D-glutamate--2,6-diaminopimelate ligase, partial [Clostridia bacterium]|nr:UDP-N-acetylmuramoyl-L-alanyl-D-glutamate--2,6-diaminopimelate ligase [Clostridia bacterium]